MCVWRLALSGFKAGVALVDDIESSFTAHHLAVAVAFLQCLQRGTNFHEGMMQRRGLFVKGFVIDREI